jgi:hypothetical protein
VSHLKIVGTPELPRKRRPPRSPYTNDLLSADEQRRAIQALRNLRDAFGTWPCLAEAMNVPVNAIMLAMRRRNITPAMLLAASKASGLSIGELLGAPVPADRCRVCGMLKRRVA